jgi:hypothetical protein
VVDNGDGRLVSAWVRMSGSMATASSGIAHATRRSCAPPSARQAIAADAHTAIISAAKARGRR